MNIMNTDPASRKYPVVEVVDQPGTDRKAPHSKHSHGANDKADGLQKATVEPAKGPNIGIYTSSGKLDGQSAEAQALLKAKNKKAGGCQS